MPLCSTGPIAGSAASMSAPSSDRRGAPYSCAKPVSARARKDNASSQWHKRSKPVKRWMVMPPQPGSIGTRPRNPMNANSTANVPPIAQRP